MAGIHGKHYERKDIWKTMQTKAIALTGGIATGKSLVSGFFKELGATIINTDEVATHILVPGSPVIELLASAFGQGIITPDHGLHRGNMLELLRKNPYLLEKQLEILAPFILPRIDTLVQQEIQGHPEIPVIVEAPLVFEYGHCDRYWSVIVVYAPRKQQIDRLTTRSGKDNAWAESVIDIQMPIGEKMGMADFIIDNSGDPSETRIQVEHMYPFILKEWRR